VIRGNYIDFKGQFPAEIKLIPIGTIRNFGKEIDPESKFPL